MLYMQFTYQPTHPHKWDYVILFHKMENMDTPIEHVLLALLLTVVLAIKT